ncbi:hypothetical protein FRB99_005500 [Tulasnella sp. 403]|nr:hypothetical protein FRB99_005500 [Tulasnella sp. 403]
MRNIVVLISGSGTNLQALIDACASGEIPNARISLVISNRKAAYGLTRARNATPPIRTDYLALTPFLNASTSGGDSAAAGKPAPTRTRVDYDLEIARMVLQFGLPDLVVLAGWMHVLSADFLDVLEGRRDGLIGSPSEESSESPPVPQRVPQPVPVINLHPALPGAFDGANAIQRAFEAFQAGEITKTGVMVHHVVSEVDRGAPIVVREVEIETGDTVDQLEARIHAVEHTAIVEAARKALEVESVTV